MWKGQMKSHEPSSPLCTIGWPSMIWRGTPAAPRPLPPRRSKTRSQLARSSLTPMDHFSCKSSFFLSNICCEAIWRMFKMQAWSLEHEAIPKWGYSQVIQYAAHKWMSWTMVLQKSCKSMFGEIWWTCKISLGIGDSGLNSLMTLLANASKYLNIETGDSIML